MICPNCKKVSLNMKSIKEIILQCRSCDKELDAEFKDGVLIIKGE